ncbi:MAG: diphosphomevalonate decarboxylase [Anaerolineales bacterium]
MSTSRRYAVARAHPNLALIKYWGNRDDRLRIPANGSISMTLAAFATTTSVEWVVGQSGDRLSIDQAPVRDSALSRVTSVLDEVRARAGFADRANVVSTNSFPAEAGLASSASAFAALTLAASAAAGLALDSASLSRIARRGSGSASRSVPGGWVEWFAGSDDVSSFAATMAPADHWDLMDLVVLIDARPKVVGSTQGHTRANTSPLQASRVADAPHRLKECREALLGRDFSRLASIAELDSNLMHAVMATSEPPLLYLQEPTVRVLHEVARWRHDNLAVFYTVDAGPNVHLVTSSDSAEAVAARAREMPGVRVVLSSGVGGSALVLEGGDQSG